MLPNSAPLGGVTFARFFPSDWRSGCFCLNLEEEGLYIRACAWMYDTGQALPGNDATAARLLNVQVQKYSKVMQSLIDKGKMIRAQGVLINKRVFDEIDKFRSQQATRSDAAKRREQERKDRLAREATDVIVAARSKAKRDATPLATPPPTPPPTPPRLVGGYPQETPPRLIEGEEKKRNEINENPARLWQETTTPVADAGDSRSQNLERIEEEGSVILAANAAPPQSGNEHVNALDAFHRFNALAQRIGLPVARTLTPQRRKLLMARLREHGGIAAWDIALANVEQSAFLQGRNDRGWKCDLDFLIQASRFAKVVDGTYGNGAHGRSSGKTEETAEDRTARLVAAAFEDQK